MTSFANSPAPRTRSARASSLTSSSTTPAGVPPCRKIIRNFSSKSRTANSPVPARGARSGRIWWNSNSTTSKLWDLIADSLLIWCRRGVDGFRCDAGYKIPAPAWQYIVARVQDEFPETIFLLEGLGGSWEATEALLTEGGMQWAYSELFQNYSGRDVAWYLDYANRQSERVGSYVHYSETHDNDRLAAKQLASAGRSTNLVPSAGRCCATGLCALTSPSGGFGFTCGVEWLADRKNSRPRQHRPELGQRRQHRPRTRAAQPAHLGPSVFFRWRETHALERARFARLCAAPRIRRGQGFRFGSGQHRC